MKRLNESRIVVRDGFAARASQWMASDPHAPHAAAVFVGVDGDVTVSTPDAPPARGRVVLVAPNTVHAARCEGPVLGLLFDPERLRSVAGYVRAQPAAACVPEPAVARGLLGAVRAHRSRLLDPAVLVGLAGESALRLGAEGAAPRVDPRILRLVDALRDADADRRAAVTRTGLSDAHVRELFARDVGVPMRTWALWHRLVRGLLRFATTDATTAAHDAGFADLAHFSRTCRRMIGYSPTALRRGLLIG